MEKMTKQINFEKRKF